MCKYRLSCVAHIIKQQTDSVQRNSESKEERHRDLKLCSSNARKRGNNSKIVGRAIKRTKYKLSGIYSTD